MRGLLTIVFVLFFGIIYSQDWALFNKNYRYNYSLETEDYTTVVIFADSVLTQGADTIYALNRIAAGGFELDPNQPSLDPHEIATTYIYGNQPQFMQRRIVYSNNQYRFSDTNNYIIPRHILTGSIWTFDAFHGITAQLVMNEQQNYFGILDSVKTILLSTADTIKLSKQFGIIKFPAQFGQQVYYKLRGIENASSYDLTSLYGEKVPNFYEFNLLKPGIKIYYSTVLSRSGSAPQCVHYYFGKKSVISSSYSSTSIINQFAEVYKGCSNTCQYHFPGLCYYDAQPWAISYAPSFSYIKTDSISFNYGFDLIYRNSYNNQLIKNDDGTYSVAKFGKLSNGTFIKNIGVSCFERNIQSDPKANVPISNAYASSIIYPEAYYHDYLNNNFEYGLGMTFGVGYGTLSIYSPWYESRYYYCVSGIIDGNDTIGHVKDMDIILSSKEVEETESFEVYPNPSSEILNIEASSVFQDAKVELYNVFGQIVLRKQFSSNSNKLLINIKDFPSGVYFVEVSDSNKIRRVKVIKE